RTIVRPVITRPLHPMPVNSSPSAPPHPAPPLLPATLPFFSATNSAVLDPTPTLASTTTYTARLKSGASGIKDLAGNALATDYVWSFTTAAAPDTTSPTVNSVTPPASATRVAASTNVSAVFT